MCISFATIPRNFVHPPPPGRQNQRLSLHWGTMEWNSLGDTQSEKLIFFLTLLLELNNFVFNDVYKDTETRNLTQLPILVISQRLFTLLVQIKTRVKVQQHMQWWNICVLFHKLNHFWNFVQNVKMKCRKGQTMYCIAQSAFYQVSNAHCKLACTLNASICSFHATGKLTRQWQKCYPYFK